MNIFGEMNQLRKRPVAAQNGEAISIEQEAEDYIHLLQTEGVIHPVDVNVDSYTMELPEWYDPILFKRAQDFYLRNQFAIFGGKLCGLIAVLAVPSILKILILTKASSLASTAYKRYVETVFHTLTWYKNELKPGSRSWKSLELVRKTHILASKHADKNKSGFITQRDMALTQFGFMGFILLKPHKLGVQLGKDEVEAFAHFWRVIGHLVGIQERFNVCTDSFHTTRSRLKLILSKIYRPYLEQTGGDFNKMARALIEGLWCFNPSLDTDASIYFTKWLAGCKDYIYFESDSEAAYVDLDGSRQIIQSYVWFTRWSIYLQITLHTYLVNFAIFRWYFNFRVWLAEKIIYWFPILAIYKFGFKQAYVRILKEVK